MTTSATPYNMSFEVKLYTKTGVFCEVVEASTPTLAIRKATEIARKCGITGKITHTATLLQQ